MTGREGGLLIVRLQSLNRLMCLSGYVVSLRAEQEFFMGHAWSANTRVRSHRIPLKDIATMTCRAATRLDRSGKPWIF